MNETNNVKLEIFKSRNGPSDKQFRRIVFNLFQKKCIVCKKELRFRRSKNYRLNHNLAHVHHIITLQGEFDKEGRFIYGKTEISNSLLVCEPCHHTIHAIKTRRQIKRHMKFHPGHFIREAEWVATECIREYFEQESE